MNFRATDDGRWVLGDKNARCPKCNHEAAVHYATNGKAELWHAPTDCCDYARTRERRFHAMSQADERFTNEMDDRARGWPTRQEPAA